MPQYKFKVGDPVIYRIGESSGNKPGELWHNLTIKRIEIFSYGIRYFCDSNPKANLQGHVSEGSFCEEWLTLDKSRVILPTDQELADKYRALRDEATSISDQLRQRGFILQAQLSGETSWNSNIAMGVKYRFTKTETTTTTL